MTSANLLTLFRMFLVPLFVLMLVYQMRGGALAAFLLAGLTDLLDGLVARRFEQRTPLGTVLDPVADKLLLVTSFVVLSMESLSRPMRIPLWLTVTVISRDLLLVGGVLLINLTLGRHIFPPTLMGKATTVCQLLTVLTVLVGNYLQKPVPGFALLTYSTLALTILSGLHYVGRGLRLREYDQQASAEGNR